MNTSAPVAKAAVKRVSKKTDEAVVPVPVAAPAPVAVAVPEVKKVTKKAAKAAEVAPVVAAPVVVASGSAAAPATDAVVEAPTQTVGDEIRSMVSALTTMRETISGLHGQLKKLEKRVAREIKDARKRKRRTTPVLDENGVAKPARLSIFEIPTRLSDDLCAFLAKPKGSEMSRSNVTKAVTTYITEKGLKNKHDLKPDVPLKKLLAPPEGEPLTYFNLQRYLNKHYIKAEKPAVVAVAH
jgi:chromatin remodeling complex protein RSC6